MNSFNHYSLGSVGEWLFDTVAGIVPDPEQSGFRRIHIRPRPGNGIEWVNAEYRSIRGIIKCSWELHGDSLRLRVEIPANTMGLVHVPRIHGHDGTDSLSSTVEVVQGAGWIRKVGELQNADLFEVPSGSFEFVRKR